MDILSSVIPAVISAVFSLIVAFVAYYSIKKQNEMAKSSKLAEFRQIWINSLRDAMADFQSYGMTPGVNHLVDREFYRLGTKIELLMNPNDSNYKELSDAMYAFFRGTTTLDKFSNNGSFVEICQRIIKKEWEDTKKLLK